MDSTTVSPATFTVMILLVSPAAKLIAPDGNALPVKSAALAALPPAPATAQLAVAATAVLPERVTVKVKGVDPALPSALLALVAAIDSTAAVSSLTMVPTAAALAIVAPADTPARVTLKLSLASIRVSPATLTVMTLLVSPAAKLIVPAGNALPVKSAALAALPPDPATAQLAPAVMAMLPERVTVKVNGVDPLLPSALLALVAAIESTAAASSLRMVPTAAAVLMLTDPVELAGTLVSVARESVTAKPSLGS